MRERVRREGGRGDEERIGRERRGGEGDDHLGDGEEAELVAAPGLEGLAGGRDDQVLLPGGQVSGVGPWQPGVR